MNTVIKSARTRGGKYVKQVEQNESGLYDIVDYVNGRITARYSNRSRIEAITEFCCQIADEKLYDGRKYTITS